MRLTAKVKDVSPIHASITIWQDGGNTGTLLVNADCAQKFVDYINAYDESALIDKAKAAGTIAAAELAADHAEVVEAQENRLAARLARGDLGITEEHDDSVAAHGVPGGPNAKPLVDPRTCFEDAMSEARRISTAVTREHSIPLLRALVLIRKAVTVMAAGPSRIDSDLERGLDMVEAAQNEKP